MGANHNPNISVSVSLAAAPLIGQSFGKVLGLFPLATNDLGGLRVKEYASVAEAQADQTAGDLSAAAVAAITAMFSNSPRPATVKIGNVDLVGLEDYAEGLAAVRNVDDDFYAVFIAPRTDAEIVLVAEAVEAMNKIFFFQSNDSSLLDAGLPAGLADVDGLERTVGLYHDSDTPWLDASYAAKGLVYDPDILSSTWNTDVNGVVAYTAPGITTTQRNAAIDNNINLMLPFGSEPFWVDPGVNMNGRAIYEIVTADWAYFRTQEAVTRLVLKEAARGRKIPLTAKGQSQVKSAIETVAQLGEQAQHFVPGQTRVTAYPLTQADLDERKMRFLFEAQVLGSARLISIGLVFSRDAIIAEAA